jgi:hypothetical protein
MLDKCTWAGEFLDLQLLGDAAREEQSIQRTLVLRKHHVRGTSTESHAHQPELARAITRDGIDEFQAFLLCTVPNGLGRHGLDLAGFVG